MVRRLRSEFEDFHELVLHPFKRLSKSYSNHWNLDRHRSHLPRDSKSDIFLDEDEEMQQALLDSIWPQNFFSPERVQRQHYLKPQTHKCYPLSRRSLLEPPKLSDVTVIPIIFEKVLPQRDKNKSPNRQRPESPILIDGADIRPSSPILIDEDRLPSNSNNNYWPFTKNNLQLPIIEDDQLNTRTVRLALSLPTAVDTVTINTKGSSLSEKTSINSKTAVDEYSSKVRVDPAPNYPIYDILQKQLAKEERLLDYVRGDGNCFFRALSKLMYDTDDYHKAVRSLIVDLIATNKDKFAQFVDGEDVQTHVERMSENHCWATTCEIYAAATLFQKDMYMYTPNHSNDKYSWLLFRPVFKRQLQDMELKSSPCCYVTLCNTNGNHYDRVVPIHGRCNCFLPHPQLDGIYASVDLTDS